MRMSSRAASAVFAMMLAGLLLLSAVPASAEAAPNCPPAVPPGRSPGQPPGLTNNPATPNQAQGNYPPGRCTLALSRTFAERGGTFSLSAGGFAPGERVSLSIAGIKLQDVTAGADGTIAADVVVPANAPLGATQVRASAGSQVLSANFEVVAAGATRSGASAPANQPSGLLARTGQEFGMIVSLGLSLILIGAVFVLVARRRRAAIAGGTL